MKTFNEILREDLREQFEIPYPPSRLSAKLPELTCKRCQRECGYCTDMRDHREMTERR